MSLSSPVFLSGSLRMNETIPRNILTDRCHIRADVQPRSSKGRGRAEEEWKEPRKLKLRPKLPRRPHAGNRTVAPVQLHKCRPLSSSHWRQAQASLQLRRLLAIRQPPPLTVQRYDQQSFLKASGGLSGLLETQSIMAPYLLFYSSPYAILKAHGPSLISI